MKYLLIVLLGSVVMTSYGIFSSSSSDEELRPLFNDEPEDRVATAKSVTSDWRTMVHGSDFDLSNKQLNCVKGLSEVYKPVSSSLTPAFFPYETLTKIVLAHNCLSEIRGEDFIAFKNLQVLQLHHNELELVDVGPFFTACPKLKDLDLSDNKITTVVWSKHPVWEKLPRINCTGNTITNADQAFLKNRYKQEYERMEASERTLMVCALGGFAGTSCLGTIGWGMSYYMTYNWLSCISLPIGCVSGAVVTGIAAKCRSNITSDNEVHIYF